MDLAKITDLNGINRYIMECKLIIMHLEDIAILELIDTLWNVNEVSSAVSEASSRINRYIMECKY